MYVFPYINLKKKLEIVKYNKKVQKKLDININNYIEYAKKYSTIIVEEEFEDEKINPCGVNKPNFTFKFSENKKIIMNIEYPITDFSFLFMDCKGLKKIKFKQFFRNNVTKMMGMFAGCAELEEVDFSESCDTSNVTDMSIMFFSCTKLKKIKGLDKFDTRKVITMAGMFDKCKSLEELDVSNFIIKEEANIDYMFSGIPEKTRKEINELPQFMK